MSDGGDCGGGWLLQLLVVVVEDRWWRRSWKAGDLGRESAQLRLERSNGVTRGGGEGLVEHRCLVEGVDGGFRVGDSVAKRDDDGVDARRGRVGKGSCGKEYVDLGAKLLALKAGCGCGGFECCDLGL